MLHGIHNENFLIFSCDCKIVWGKEPLNTSDIRQYFSSEFLQLVQHLIILKYHCIGKTKMNYSSRYEGTSNPNRIMCELHVKITMYNRLLKNTDSFESLQNNSLTFFSYWNVFVFFAGWRFHRTCTLVIVYSLARYRNFLDKPSRSHKSAIYMCIEVTVCIQFRDNLTFDDERIFCFEIYLT